MVRHRDDGFDSAQVTEVWAGRDIWQKGIRMDVAYVVATVLAAAAALLAAGIDVVRAEWVRTNMRGSGIPESWLTPLAVVKAVGGAGLLVGLAVAPIAVAAAAGLVVYFVGAELTLLRARQYAHIGYPLPFLALAAASLGFALAS
ncbi:DoxX family protein [Nocardia abscessus]|uniref:DoxX family protein n=2 Tax=Nocardia abscessus TaxID=120957 RepID=UPI0024576C87|nr:DoxX family protein [Nocardia abscessus]